MHLQCTHSTCEERGPRDIFVALGYKNKPSTNPAVDVVDDSQEKEDVMPRRSRSRRGRKKPVIEDSQGEAREQVTDSGRMKLLCMSG